MEWMDGWIYTGMDASHVVAEHLEICKSEGEKVFHVTSEASSHRLAAAVCENKSSRQDVFPCTKSRQCPSTGSVSRMAEEVKGLWW